MFSKPSPDCKTTHRLDRRGRDRRVPRDRRGILLLISLSMLVLFMMVGTAFVVSARLTRDSAKSQTQAAARRASVEQQATLLDEVVRQLLRDTINQNSSLRAHSLLRDMYGDDGFIGRILPIDSAVGPRQESVRWAGAMDNGGTLYDIDISDDAVRPQDSDITHGQILEFDFGEVDPNTSELIVRTTSDKTQFIATNPTSTAYPRTLSPLRGAYNGQVLTFTEGPARGQSTRILDYRPFHPGNPAIPGRLRVKAFRLADGTLLPNNPQDPADTQVAQQLQELLAESRFVVNGRPFSGTGIGFAYQATAAGSPPRAQLGAVELGREVALTPHARFTQTYLNPNFAGLGGSDESYDAPDYQNMALGLLQPNPTETSLQPATLGNTPLPSMHRPALLNYWANGPSSVDLADPANLLLLRRTLLRPNWFDHPMFSGSNPDIPITLPPDEKLKRMIYGPWDVDNDNDGFRDSIWVDFGAPVMPGPDGRLVKPLAAILCIDLDGRLNVNAHETLELAGHGANPFAGQPAGRRVAGNTLTQQLPKGIGYGPAEIALEPVLGNRAQALMGGTANWPGRYGYQAVDNRPGRVDYDPLSLISMFGWPDATNLYSSFASPPDLHARYASGVNEFGQIIYDAIPANGTPEANLVSDSPYEIDLSNTSVRGASEGGADAPFTLAELERPLRAYDVDAALLPDRLWDLGNLAGTPNDRFAITTDSYDLPTPNMATPPKYRELIAPPPVGRLPNSVAELLEIRVRATLGLPLFPQPLSMNQASDVRRIVSQLLSPNLSQGIRLNINRPLGNGRDDRDMSTGAPNGVVDEPFEQEGSLWRFDDRFGGRIAAANAGGTNAMDQYDDATETDDAATGNPRYQGELAINAMTGTVQAADPRQMQARHLYVLALLNATDPTTFNPTTVDSPEGRLALQMAQWAINTVDFRDSDSIMSTFEFDVNPFDGWDVDGWVGGVGPDGIGGTGDDAASGDDNNNNRGLVYGTERPEMVMTETLAWHDRRTHDSAQEDPYPPRDRANTTEAQREPDVDYDQLLRPRGALFVELYNPWSPNSAPSADIHAVETVGNTDTLADLGVDLSAVDRATGSSPVWRMAIYKRRNVPIEDALAWDPDDPLEQTQVLGRMDRSVYFTNFDPGYGVEHGVAYYSSFGAPRMPVDQRMKVRPGRYAVVGAGEPSGNNVFEAPIADPIGSRNPNNQTGPSRRMELARPGAASAQNAVRMMNENDQPVTDPTAGNMPLQSPAESDLQTINPDMRLLGDQASQSVADVAIIDEPRRLSVSEPANGYPRDFRGAEWDGKQYVAKDTKQPLALDIPLDGPLLGNQLAAAQLIPGEYRDIDEAKRRVDAWDRDKDPRMTYSMIYLQRLANPLLPYNPEPGETGHDPSRSVNPYRTIDSMSVNLTVYNSVMDREEDDTSANIAGENFVSLQRGASAASQPAAAATALPPLWDLELDLKSTRGRIRPPRSDDQFRRGTAANPNKFNFTRVPQHTLGFLNEGFQDPAAQATAAANYRRQLVPREPFSVLAWNNRPYVSSNELLLVPQVRSSQLLKQYTTADPATLTDPTTNWPYDVATLDAKGQPQKQDGFAHLADFFYDDPSITPTGVPNANGLHRLLEYVQTPSLYVGTDEWLNPRWFYGTPAQPILNADDPRGELIPPFNKVSKQRDPGRVNLNTIAHQTIWDGMMHRGVPGAQRHLGPSFGGNGGVALSRRGYTGTTDDLLELNDQSPTFFANPFRAPGTSDLAPLQTLVRPGIESGLLRSDSIDPPTTTPNRRLFAEDRIGPQDAINTNKHSQYHYEPLTRLDNLATTRSNVYAVWVTIGFFEVEAFDNANSDHQTILARYGSNNGTLDDARTDPLFARVYPDGYMFGREAGSDLGDVRRLRGFYILDRTIPVGFEPGADHNVDNAIRLRRQIE